jgi:hypothetical protein
MGKTLILKPLLRSPNSISFMLIIFTFQLIQTIRILWFCHRSEVENSDKLVAPNDLSTPCDLLPWSREMSQPAVLAKP